MNTHIDIVVIRDPDSATELAVFIDGKQIKEYGEYQIDGGAGYEWPDWASSRDADLMSTTGELHDYLLECYANPAGGQYIDGVPVNAQGDSDFLAPAFDAHEHIYREFNNGYVKRTACRECGRLQGDPEVPDWRKDKT